MLQAAEALPVKRGLLGKGNSSRPGPLVEPIVAGKLGIVSTCFWRALERCSRLSFIVFFAGVFCRSPTPPSNDKRTRDAFDPKKS
jgi:hypothetical protein